MKANVCLITMQLVALLVTSCDHQKSTGTTGVVPSGGSSGVVITKDAIVLNSPNITKSDAEKINSILKHYDKKLFKLEEYQNGQLTKYSGERSATELKNDFRAANLSPQVNKGFSHYSGSVKCCGGGSGHATPTPGPTPPASVVASDKEFNELKRILGQNQ